MQLEINDVILELKRSGVIFPLEYGIPVDKMQEILKKKYYLVRRVRSNGRIGLAWENFHGGVVI